MAEVESDATSIAYGPVTLEIRRPHDKTTDELSKDVYWFWQMHPRTVFVKSIALGGKILDFGAGNGALHNTQYDYEPRRPDQKFYAFDLFKGEKFDEYEDYQVGNFEDTDLKWGADTFDAVFAAHVLEHLHDLRRFFDEAWRVLRPGGKIYIETPAPYTGAFPYCNTVTSQGFPVNASNFFEDPTHVRPVSLDFIKSLGVLQGLQVQIEGYIQSDFFADSLLSYARDLNQSMYGMFGIWAKTSWAQYLVLQKPDAMVEFIRSCPINLRRP